MRVEGNVAPFPDPGSTPGVSTNLTFDAVPPQSFAGRRFYDQGTSGHFEICFRTKPVTEQPFGETGLIQLLFRRIRFELRPGGHCLGETFG
jgi:hypothetical protein